MKILIATICLLFATSVGATSQLASNQVVELNPDNTVVYRGQVDGLSATNMILRLLGLAAKRGTADYPIYLVLDCPGGSIYAGEQFIQAVKLIPNLKTVTIFAASMCSAIVEGLPGERLIVDNGILMFHRAKGSFQGQFEDGEVESQLKLWKSIVHSMEQRNADRMSISVEQYKSEVKDELWLYGSDNISQKTADRTVDLKCTNELMAQMETVTEDGLFGPSESAFSGCPLLRIPLSTK